MSNQEIVFETSNPGAASRRANKVSEETGKKRTLWILWEEPIPEGSVSVVKIRKWHEEEGKISIPYYVYQVVIS